ncbi:MAG TPA: GH92 family glycosyl hydrolase [Myxococcota bacterium]|nr:GH92 family glycosyl hydrolase [Myxococcota bacterium]
MLRILVVLSACASLAAFAGACHDKGPGAGKLFCPSGQDLAAEVDPMIGTLGSGNVVPGALVPHGMVKLSPDSVVEPGSVDSYEYGSDKIEGFSHTHLQGPGGGANGYSQILLMPATGPLKTASADYASTISHDSEQASPGYYAVTLDDYGVRVELSATAHAGIQRYSFPRSDSARVLIDVGHSRGDSRGGKIELVDDHTFEGYGVYNVHPLLDLLLSHDDKLVGGSTVYFHAVFSKAFESHGTWRGKPGETVVNQGADSESGPWIGAFTGFTTGEGETIEVRVGISFVGVAQARRNLEEEIGERTFDEVRKAARDAWNCRLNRVQVEGGTPAQRRIFYTALYHTLFAPADYTEAGGYFFSGADGEGEVFNWEDHHFYTDDWCAWDTFRTSRPLATLIEPGTVSDVVASYLHLYEQGGWLPKCTWHATGYSGVMIGNHAVSIIADAYTKDLRDYDRDLAWAAIEKSATQEDPDRLVDGLCGYVNLGTPPEYLENGYISHECDAHQSASMTLEYAYDDWCIAQVAEQMGKTDERDAFLQRAQNYRKQWNPQTSFMQGRHRDGSWVMPFDPTDDADANDFCEATSWIYTWFVPQDVPGLIDLLGGDGAFLTRLDEFFTNGQFDPSNEPSFHVPYLYNLAGEPWRTQELVRQILADEFSDKPDGLPGNDDSGATSAWLVFAAMGLYPLAPGDGAYQISSPWFTKITLRLDPAVYPGKEFVIRATGSDDSNKYIKSASLNGQALTDTRLSHEQIISGGELDLEMQETIGDQYKLRR